MVEEKLTLDNRGSVFGIVVNMIFDGKAFANELQSALSYKVIELSEKLGRKPVLATIYNPGDKASRIYTEIKAKKAAEMGIDFSKFNVQNSKLNEVSELIKKLNIDKEIAGIMIQTPLFRERESGRVEEQELCKLIDPKKDCDGLNPASGVMPATVKAVLKILEFATPSVSLPKLEGEVRSGGIVVVGQRGLVGSNLMIQLSKNPNIQLVGMSANQLYIDKLKTADVIVSATGEEGLIKPEMIKFGATCIDVGYPKGDFCPNCAEKAGFFTPVPGGVGPVTVVCLFENLIELINGE